MNMTAIPFGTTDWSAVARTKIATTLFIVD